MKKKIAYLLTSVFAFVKKHSLVTCIVALLITAVIVTFACKDLSEQAPGDKDTVSDILISASSEDIGSQNVVSSEKQENTSNDNASSNKDVSSDNVVSKVETEESEPSKLDSQKEDTSKGDSTSSKDTSSNVTPSHKHSYTKKVVKPTCTKDGYTQYTCQCGKVYKDDTTYKLGHLYLDWKVTKKATTTSTGIKECTCDRCGKGTITETIPKKKEIANVSSKVEVTTSFGKTKYILGNASVLDRRTWGDPPTITVYNKNCMHVVYFNKKGEKVEFNVEQPIVDDTINGYTILDDGTYVSQYFGSYS